MKHVVLLAVLFCFYSPRNNALTTLYEPDLPPEQENPQPHIEPPVVPEVQPHAEPPVIPNPLPHPQTPVGGEPQPSLCFPCMAGTYAELLCSIPANRPNNSEPLCPSGECLYGQLGHITNCTLCSPGSYQNNNYQNNCIACEPGHYSRDYGNRICPQCQEGTYCPNRGTINPQECDVGKYCPYKGMVEGDWCPAGFKCIGMGNTQALPCDPGFYCTGRDAIPIQCPIDSYCKEKCSACTPCFSPFFGSEAAQSQCRATPVLYVVVILGVLMIGLIGFFVWTTIVKKREEEEELTRAAEITNLIPRPEGPKYSGL